MERFGSFANYLNFLREQGYTGTDLEIVDGSGNFYFYSPVLNKLNWVQQSDILTAFLKDLEKDNLQLGQKKLSVSLNFTALSLRVNEVRGRYNPRTKKPAPNEMGNFVLDLEENYKFDDYSARPFMPDTQSVIHASLSSARKKLSLLAGSPETERYISAALELKDEIALAPVRFVALDDLTGSEPSDIGDRKSVAALTFGDLIFALARTLNKEVWSGTNLGTESSLDWTHNILLYRTAQYAPAGFMLIPQSASSPLYDSSKFNFAPAIKKDISEFRALGAAENQSKKPVANLVLSLQPEPEMDLRDILLPVMNALLANGYEIKVTFGKLWDGAELYYILNSSEWSKNILFFDALLNLMDHRKSHFYGTVILHPLAEIQRGGRWGKIRELFRIPPGEKGWIEDLPAEVMVRGKRIPWKGNDLSGRLGGMTFVREAKVRIEGGEVFLAEVFENETFALILKSGNHYLINGNFLHLEAGYFLSQLMGDALQAPAPVLVTSDKQRTVALAVGNAQLKLKVPPHGKAERWRVVHFNRDGQRIRDDLAKAEKIFQTRLKPFELIILQPEKTD